MPTRLPQFVRLGQHLVQGTQVDMDSGWGISGRDVRQVPDDPAIQEYIADGLRRGVFEEAGQAEWDEVHEADLDDAEQTPVVRFVHASEAVPENKLRHQVKAKRVAIEKRHAERDAALELGEDDDASDEDDIRTWSDDDLKTALQERGLATTGQRKTLITRLNKAFEAEEAEGDEEDGDEEDA